MLRVLIGSIWAAASALLTPSQNLPTTQPVTSKWRTIGNFFLSTLSNIGIPLIRTMTEGEALYECVNTLLANPTATTVTRNHTDHPSNLSRHSRPNFRRRIIHNGRNVRITKQVINIHIH
jgi:hypothetical protein